MKKILLVFITAIFILSISCTNLDEYVPVEQYNDLQEANREILDEYKILVEEKNNLKYEINDLESKLSSAEKEAEKDLQLTEEELQQYKNLITDLNKLLSNVYYVYQKKSDGSSSWGTGFSIEYNGEFYLITAGHIVDGQYGVFKNLGFKANFSDKWIYPELLAYEVTETVPDYAIFSSDKVKTGLKIDRKETLPDFRLGYGVLNVIIKDDRWGKSGECGSPIIDLDGEVIGIHVGHTSDIDIVLDNLE